MSGVYVTEPDLTKKTLEFFCDGVKHAHRVVADPDLRKKGLKQEIADYVAGICSTDLRVGMC